MLNPVQNLALAIDHRLGISRGPNGYPNYKSFCGRLGIGVGEDFLPRQLGEANKKDNLPQHQ